MWNIALRMLGVVFVCGAASLATACAIEDGRAPGAADFEGYALPSVPSGRCVDGAVQACHVPINRHDDVVNCFSGVTTCVDGVWGPCSSPSGGVVSGKRLVSDDDDGVNTKALRESTSTGGICATNPCDPNCRSYDERPDLALSGTAVVSTWYENQGNFGGSPPGFINKLVREPCNSPIDCGYDMHCEYSTRKCVPNAPGWTYGPAMCNKQPDVTVGAACEVNGRVTLPVCNRGTVAIPAGTNINVAIKNGDWIRQPECPTTVGTAACNHALAKPLYPGTCVVVDTCGWSGNAVAFVNFDRKISECPGTNNELGCADNWSDVKVVPCVLQSFTSYEPVVLVEDYVASCPIGSRTSWQLLTYTASAPTNASGASGVKFEAQTAPKLAGGAIGAYSALITLADTRAGDPAGCYASGPAPCPKDVFTTLGARAGEEHLRLRITVSPTPDQQRTASLSSWQLSYSCVPVE